jgi:hypothetical protein
MKLKKLHWSSYPALISWVALSAVVMLSSAIFRIALSLIPKLYSEWRQRDESGLRRVRSAVYIERERWRCCSDWLQRGRLSLHRKRALANFKPWLLTVATKVLGSYANAWTQIAVHLVGYMQFCCVHLLYRIVMQKNLMEIQHCVVLIITKER